MWLTYKLGLLKCLTWHTDRHTRCCHMMWLKEEVRCVGQRLSTNGKTATASGHSCFFFFFPFVFTADSIDPLSPSWLSAGRTSWRVKRITRSSWKLSVRWFSCGLVVLTSLGSGPGPSCFWLTNLTDCLSQDFSVPRRTTR